MKNKSKKYFIFVLFLFIYFGKLHSKDLPANVISDITLFEKWMDIMIDEHSLPGIAVGIVQNKKLLYSKGFGLSNVSKNKKMTVNSVQPIASITKLFTSISLMKLVENNIIELEDPVVEIIPEIKKLNYGNYNIELLNILSLLRHTSGLPLNNDIEIKLNSDINVNFKNFLKRIGNQKLLFKPNTYHKYSNLGMNIGGVIIERVSKKNYTDYVKEAIINPLGMNFTKFDIRKENEDTIGYSRKISGARRYGDYPSMGKLLGLPASGLKSNIIDLSKFISWHFETLNGESEKIISSDTLLKMQTPSWVPLETEMPETLNNGLTTFSKLFGMGGIGLGYFIDKNIVKHSGGLNGYASELIMDNANQIGVVVLANSSDAPIFWGHKSSISRNLYEIVAQAFINSHNKINEQFLDYQQLFTDHHHFYYFFSASGDNLLLYDLKNSFPKQTEIKLNKLKEDIFEDQSNKGFYGKEFKIKFIRNSKNKVVSVLVGNNMLSAVK